MIIIIINLIIYTGGVTHENPSSHVIMSYETSIFTYKGVDKNIMLCYFNLEIELNSALKYISLLMAFFDNSSESQNQFPLFPIYVLHG